MLGGKVFEGKIPLLLAVLLSSTNVFISPTKSYFSF